MSIKILLRTITILAPNQWPNDRRVFLPTNKTTEGIFLAIVGKFLQKELWSLFVFETLLFIQTIKILFMNMSAK